MTTVSGPRSDARGPVALSIADVDAIGNATAEVKAQADVVTEANERDGFAKAVDPFVLRPIAAQMGGQA